MRADRLLSLLLLLQSRGKLRAAELAGRLQVSERTIYRDVEALSAAGVPVTAQPGPSGGVELVGDWQTRLTGLTDGEAQALAALSVPERLGDIGLSDALRAGLIKLAAGLPAREQRAAEHARRRLHIDATAWFAEPEEVPHLAVLRDAVWQDRKVRLVYENLDGRGSEPEVDPYGLVIKADRWYLVAGTAKGPVAYRGSRVLGARLLDEPFVRPPSFDLSAFWQEWCRQFTRQRPSYWVTLRLTPEGEAALCRVRPAADGERLASVAWGNDGRKVAALDFERQAIALGQLVTLGACVEVLEPPELRERLAEIARDLQAVYGSENLARD